MIRGEGAYSTIVGSWVSVGVGVGICIPSIIISSRSSSSLKVSVSTVLFQSWQKKNERRHTPPAAPAPAVPPLLEAGFTRTAILAAPGTGNGAPAARELQKKRMREAVVGVSYILAGCLFGFGSKTGLAW
jgi:hypothetical protein